MQNFLVRLRRLAGLRARPARVAVAGCDDSPTENTPPTDGALTVILNSGDRTLTVVPTQGPAPAQPTTIQLGPTGTPVNFAVRNQTAIVPMGLYPFAVVVSVPAGQVTRTIALPQGSGATGAAFLNNAVAVVGNPDRNTVSPVNVNTGVVGPEVAVGVYPHRVYEHSGQIFTLNAELGDDFLPEGPGTITVLNSSLQVVRTIELSGMNPGAAVFRGTEMYVLNAGTFGGNNGSLSVVDLLTLTEEAHLTGFGEFPGALAEGSDSNLWVGVYGTGLLVWNPQTRTFVRGLNNPVLPGGGPPVSAVAFDRFGKMHTANPRDCFTQAGSAYRLTTAGVLERTVPTGICPFFIAFADQFPPD